MYDLKEFKEIFDPILNDFITKRIDEFLKKTSDPFIQNIVLHSKTLILSGGKRIRPYIAYVMYITAGGKKTQDAINLFVAFEIFHMFALIHDDVMDKQDLRHGVDTIHSYALKKLSKEKRGGDLENVAKGQAILIGDLFFSWAMEIFLDNKNFPAENLAKAHEYFYKMADEVCLGQMLDIDTTTRETISQKLIFEKTILKTARYTFVRPSQIGALLANPNNKLDEYLETFGTKIGFAFQLQDDLLDIVGDTKILEKSLLRDVAERQHTFFTNFIFENGTKEQKEKFTSLFGKDLNEKEKNEIIKIFMETGAIKEGLRLITQNLEEVKKLISKSNLGSEHINACHNLIKIMEERQKLNFLGF